MFFAYICYNKNMECIVQNKIVLIDKEDLEIFNKYKWHISDSGYVVWRGTKDGKKQTIRLHRLIMNPPKELVVDHINRNRLDNRKSNLRCVTQKINAINSNRVENAKGYYLSKSKVSNIGKWVVDYKGIRNTFNTEEEARKAVEGIKKGVFVKRKNIIHAYCQNCGSKKEWYGSAWVCRKCSLKRMKQYYLRKKEKLCQGQKKEQKQEK